MIPRSVLLSSSSWFIGVGTILFITTFIAVVQQHRHYRHYRHPAKNNNRVDNHERVEMMDDGLRWNGPKISRRINRRRTMGNDSFPPSLENIFLRSASYSNAFLESNQDETIMLLPSGPFVTESTANELVKIPDPPKPTTYGIPDYSSSSSSSSSNCPHHHDDLLDWHSNSTWSNTGFVVPTSGNSVTLPEYTRVIIRQSVAGILGTITIPSSSELLFDEIVNDNSTSTVTNTATGIELNAYRILVEGKFTIGSETCRITTPITITLYGSRPVDAVTNIPPSHYKGISVTGSNGIISLHGQRFYRTWSRLAMTVEPGATYILVQHEINWMPGQEIVLVTTAMKDSREWHRNEVGVIQRVERQPVPGVGAVVFLEQPVMYQHLAIPSGFQGEVGLLSRTIKIQGNDDSEPTDPDPLTCQYDHDTTQANRDIFGDKGRPCPNTELTGFGGHIIIQNGGRGFVEGVELYRMGQTNVMGRYPMHFHLLGDCPECYFRDSSIHRSFYRGVSIHGTNYINVTENVAYDVLGSCYYLEDGVEHHNRIEYNLGAHIHLLGPQPPWGNGQNIEPYLQNIYLTMPSDVSAAPFYITNVHNYVIGNAASGGWAGFAFPNLPAPIAESRHELIQPSSVTSLTIDGNTAHSTAWWWRQSSAFYFGGSLKYNDDGILEYNAGRDIPNNRRPCLVNKCLSSGCGSFCRQWEQAWIQVSNSKAFLIGGIGFSSWSGQLEVLGYECHDCGLSLAALSHGFWMNDLLAVCRTKSPIALPENASADQIRADGFRWYDTGQEHIITGATFRNCGYRSDEFDQYDQGENRGCGNETDIGCDPRSSVWSFVTHSDQHVPEVMQATRAVSFQNCGRRFSQHDFRQDKPSSVSGREQNWYDTDGTISGFGESSVVASGTADAGRWWQVDHEVVYDSQGPLWFFKLNNGPQRGLGHFNMKWDATLDSQIGMTQCGNGQDIPCERMGFMKHLGPMFANDTGLPVTVNAEIVGPVGGFGWKLELDKGAPKSVEFSEIEVDPSTPMLLSIAYPANTSFKIAYVAGYCNDSPDYSCNATFHQVESVDAVRNSWGDTYHVDSNGVLTLRIVMTPKTFSGRPDYFFPQWSDVGKNGLGVAIERFERAGIILPEYVDGTYLKLEADCPSLDGVYCSEVPAIYEPEVCLPGYNQTGYDTCTSNADDDKRLYADGSVQVKDFPPDVPLDEGNFTQETNKFENSTSFKSDTTIVNESGGRDHQDTTVALLTLILTLICI